jgi:hypothetical protein
MLPANILPRQFSGTAGQALCKNETRIFKNETVIH